jgi:hypothetical protein
MSNTNLLTNVELRRVSNRAAGTPATVKCTIVDMEGFEAVTFVAAFQTVVNDSVVTLKAAQGTVNNTANMTASVATLGAITSDGTDIALSNKMLALTVVKPRDRYVECQIVIADQNAPIDSVVAILSGARDRPTVQGSTVISSATFQTPANA